jgi:hypothetical protein
LAETRAVGAEVVLDGAVLRVKVRRGMLTAEQREMVALGLRKPA